jgi:hypothetical protein
MHEKSQHGRLVAVNGIDPAERAAMEAAGVRFSPVRHVRMVLDGKLVDYEPELTEAEERDVDRRLEDDYFGEGWWGP